MIKAKYKGIKFRIALLWTSMCVEFYLYIEKCQMHHAYMHHLYAFPPFPTRAADREHAPCLKSAENANIQPNPGLILRAEPTVTNILKVGPVLVLILCMFSMD